MRLTELLRPEDVVLAFDPEDKWTAIEWLVEHLVERGHLAADARGDVLEAVLSRERSMSTGMEHGVAIPHAAVEEVGEIVACMGVVQAEDGLPFESIDGDAARLIVLLVIPKAQKLLHIRTLAEAARVLAKESVRAGLLGASAPTEAHAILVAGET
ncbi:MAG: PTS sugar transporter subunit IIA [Planctomycetota bacterium]